MLGGLSFVEDPDLSGNGGPAFPQHLPPWVMVTVRTIMFMRITLMVMRRVRLSNRTGALLRGG